VAHCGPVVARSIALPRLGSRVRIHSPAPFKSICYRSFWLSDWTPSYHIATRRVSVLVSFSTDRHRLRTSDDAPRFELDTLRLRATCSRPQRSSHCCRCDGMAGQETPRPDRLPCQLGDQHNRDVISVRSSPATGRAVKFRAGHATFSCQKRNSSEAAGRRPRRNWTGAPNSLHRDYSKNRRLLILYTIVIRIMIWRC
jgi:hypothetical protein